MKNLIAKAEKRESCRLTNYIECYEYCLEKIGNIPARKLNGYDVKGTFGCNGRLIWRCFGGTSSPLTSSNSSRLTRIIDSGPRNYDCTGIMGSRHLYSFRGNSPLENRLNCRFLSCYCKKCENGCEQDCKSYVHIGRTRGKLIEKKREGRGLARERSRRRKRPRCEEEE